MIFNRLNDFTIIDRYLFFGPVPYMWNPDDYPVTIATELVMYDKPILEIPKKYEEVLLDPPVTPAAPPKKYEEVLLAPAEPLPPAKKYEEVLLAPAEPAAPVPAKKAPEPLFVRPPLMIFKDFVRDVPQPLIPPKQYDQILLPPPPSVEDLVFLYQEITRYEEVLTASLAVIEAIAVRMTVKVKAKPPVKRAPCYDMVKCRGGCGNPLHTWDNICMAKGVYEGYSWGDIVEMMDEDDRL
jgi:hypothetical protein